MYSYNCLMLDFRVKDWDNWTQIINPEDVAEDGFSDQPHITLLYGFLPEEVNHQDVQKVLPSCRSFRCELNGMSLFENEDCDVLKYDITLTKELRRWNGILSRKFPCVIEHPEYIPHMTIAYLKSGTGSKYLRYKPKDESYILIPHQYRFSYSTGNEAIFQ